MDIDYDAETWFGNPTPDEMMRQQLSLVETENDLLRAEVERYRANQAKLIRMLSETTDERDMARREADGCSKKLSDMYVDNARLSNELRGVRLQIERAQCAARPYPFTHPAAGSDAR